VIAVATLNLEQLAAAVQGIRDRRRRLVGAAKELAGAHASQSSRWASASARSAPAWAASASRAARFQIGFSRNPDFFLYAPPLPIHVSGVGFR
jgi:hypothetical protein